jgi:oxalate decarboxylase/phosphoglucose isomerase-like protein (cupin superfamily)
MIIRPEDIETGRLENFKGGEKHLEARMFFDGTNRILTRARLIPGASIGMHTHEDSCEVIFILEGKGTILEKEPTAETESVSPSWCIILPIFIYVCAETIGFSSFIVFSTCTASDAYILAYSGISQ